ncbi:MAG TPA: aspartate/glutamate racemase family protein [Bacteroidota bacterium]|nr:aspartate/glutamate racemase family protein [Bacteroidota bacterium]
MKTIGLIGGTSWISTVEYYRIINQLTNERLGGLNSAKILLYSINFEDFKPPSDPNGWGPVVETLTGIARRLEHAGADCLLLCANTPHMAAAGVQKNIRIPLIHIAEVTSQEIAKQKLSTVGLLGTKYTMELPFFKTKLLEHNICPLVPGDKERIDINASIYGELGKGVFKPETKEKYLRIIEDLKKKGAQGVILACTEIPLLLKQSDCDIPVFDTTAIHARSAVDFALSDEQMKN